MSKGIDRTVSRRPNRTWENKCNDADKASNLQKTQKEAEQTAKRVLMNQGCELTAKGLDGKIRSKDTIALGNEHNPSKDKEHSAEVEK